MKRQLGCPLQLVHNDDESDGDHGLDELPKPGRAVRATVPETSVAAESSGSSTTDHSWSIPRRFVVLDAAMNDLLRPAMYEAYHGIHNLTRLDDEAAWRGPHGSPRRRRGPPPAAHTYRWCAGSPAGVVNASRPRTPRSPSWR